MSGDAQDLPRSESGGFTVVQAYAGGDPNVYVNAGAPLEGRGLTASVAAQNKINLTGDAAADPSFGGEVAVARCQTGAVECDPAGARNSSSLVVAPRNSDGTATTADDRKRVYVVVTE